MAETESIDVRQLMAETSVEELNRLAEEYFARVSDWNFHLAKPFGSIDEVPQLLINLAVILQGLTLCQGMTVLEFGAGTCWASRYLTQLGCRVIAMDISPTALRIGRELYERQPVFGDRPVPEFMEFDGYHIDLPDESVDRIMCLDALHHVPNTTQVLKELGRVLRKGGVAGFAEPGPFHSRSPQSQYEMRTFRVVENDIEIREIWSNAERAGFSDIKLAVFNVPAFHLSLDDFEKFLKGGPPSKRYAESVEAYLQNQRSFFLYKGAFKGTDSRFRTGLKALIEVSPQTSSVREGEQITLQAVVTNNSPSIWLPRSAGLGAVQLGCHVYDSEGKIFHHSFHWEVLTPGDGREIMPDETVEFAFALPLLPPGSYILEFDMVSNDVCWFALNGSPTMRVTADVRPSE